MVNYPKAYRKSGFSLYPMLCHSKHQYSGTQKVEDFKLQGEKAVNRVPCACNFFSTSKNGPLGWYIFGGGVFG